MDNFENNSPMFLNQPESRRLEFKETFPKGSQVVKTIIAFANGAGGKIIFGVKDYPRQIIGIPEEDLFSLEERISNHIFNACSPTIIAEIYMQHVQGKSLLVIEIFPGPNKPYFLKREGKHKGSYFRVGSSTRKASLEMIEELERQRRKISFDSVPDYSCSLKDINFDRFKSDYKKHTNKTLNKSKLRSLGLLNIERDQAYPTNAAILMSDSSICKERFPYAKIECARFKGADTRVFLDQATIWGPIYTLHELCMNFIKKNIALSSRIGEIYREDRWEYPLEAIREAIGNAIIHRDYSILGSDIKVAIFDDMLEITSPGPLPDTMPLEELGTGRSEIRNRVLAPIFKDLKLIEAWGSGIQKIKMELVQYPEIELVFKEVGYAFQVQFIKKEFEGEKPESQPEPQPESQPEPQPESLLGKVMEMLVKGPFSKSEIAKKLGQKKISGQLNKVIRQLKADGVIEYTIPDKPNSRLQKYRLRKEKM